MQIFFLYEIRFSKHLTLLKVLSHQMCGEYSSSSSRNVSLSLGFTISYCMNLIVATQIQQWLKRGVSASKFDST